MKLIRQNTFETNSSSTHALVIPHEVDNEHYELSDSLFHNYNYGREESRLVDDWDEKLAYIYIIIKELAGYEWDKNQMKISPEMIEHFKKNVNMAYKEVYDIVKYKPYDNDPKPNDIFNYIDSDGKTFSKNAALDDLVKDYITSPYVDHVGQFAEMNDFLNRIFNDYDFIKRFIFNKDGYITIGGDEYRGYNIKTIGFEYDYEENNYYENEKGELPPKKWIDANGCIKNKYWEKYCEEYLFESGEFWDKLKEYAKENDVFLKGN